MGSGFSPQTRIGSLMEQLKAEYDHRDRLWAELEKKINEIGTWSILNVVITCSHMAQS